MRSLSTLKSAYYAIAERLKAPRAYVQFTTTPRHDGSSHIESNAREIAYIITERGKERERRATSNDDDVLYWLVSDLTGEMASQYELPHRIPHVDSRRMLFQKHVELLGTVNCDWQARKQLEYEAVLEQYPFDDKVGGQSHPMEPADGRDSSGQSSTTAQ